MLMLCREPLFARAERACWWELLALASHAHPSVAAMSRTLMSGQPVVGGAAAAVEAHGASLVEPVCSGAPGAGR